MNCHSRCMEGNPLRYQYCQCACGGRMHGCKTLRPRDLAEQAHHALSNPDITPLEEKRWLRIIDALSIEDKRSQIRRAK